MMKKQAVSRGSFARVWRLAGLSLMAALVVVGPAYAQSISEADLRSAISPEAAKRLFDISDGNISGYSFRPESPGANTAADRLTITIPSKKGDITFKFDHMEHQELSKGCDQWDFFFKPVIGDKPADTPLAFDYRSNGCGQKPDWALVAGPVNKGTEIKDSRVAGLSNFGSTALAKFLGDRANKDDLKEWAKDGLHPDANKSTKSGFLDRSTSDPFATALAKIADVVASLNASLVKALQWAMDQGNLGDIKGLSDAWEVMRNLVNMLFVMVLVAISIMTMLRIDSKKYSVRATLPLLVFAVIGVNFSLLVASVLTNSAYVLAQPFAETARELVSAGGTVSSTFTGVNDADFGASVVLLLASFIMLIALLILLFFFIVRIIVLWLLAAASPVIFLALVLPLSRGESKKLFQSWIKWIYMAPIAFIVLYIGAQVVTPVLASTPGDDSGASALLRSIFYAGVLVAAVLIPLQLGGRVMAMASNPAKRGARLGGKGGLGLAGLIPTGGGKTLGQRARTVKQFAEGRSASLKQDAAYDAAGARLTMAQTPFGRSIAGLSEGQQIALQEQMVGQREKDLMPLGVPANMRIAQAWQYGTGTDASGNILARDEHGALMDGTAGRPEMQLSDQEARLAQDRFAAAAAYKQLASIDLSEPAMLRPSPTTSRSFAWSGYQKLHKGDPRIGAVELDGTLNRGSMVAKAHHMTADDLKGLDASLMRDALAGDANAIEVLRNIDHVRLSNAVNADHRNKFSTAEKMHLTNQIAQAGLLSGGLTGAARAEQEEKEEIIRNSYQHGQEAIENTT